MAIGRLLAAELLGRSLGPISGRHVLTGQNGRGDALVIDGVQFCIDMRLRAPGLRRSFGRRFQLPGPVGQEHQKGAPAGLAGPAFDQPAAVPQFQQPHELRRVPRPGGKLVFGGKHWVALVWRSGPDAPHDRRPGRPPGRTPGARVAPGVLQSAASVMDRMELLICCATRLDPDGLPMMMLRLIARYAAENRLVGADEIRAWIAEQEEINRQGRFFFSLTHFVAVAHAL